MHGLTPLGFFGFPQTIIECLKLSCTGELPPNSRSGHTFVHDPKVIRRPYSPHRSILRVSIHIRFYGRLPLAWTRRVLLIWEWWWHSVCVCGWVLSFGTPEVWFCSVREVVDFVDVWGLSKSVVCYSSRWVCCICHFLCKIATLNYLNSGLHKITIW
jgi:hypothetical protein